MNEKKLLAELTKNCNEKDEKVIELLKTYELAELGREVWRQQFKDIENRVLSENVFLCTREFTRDTGLKIGDRITDEKMTFLLSDEDFDRLQATLIPYYVEAGLTDEKGYYTKNWDTIVCDARNELVKFIIEEICPKSLAEVFRKNIWSIVMQEKLIKITKERFGLSAA